MVSEWVLEQEENKLTLGNLCTTSQDIAPVQKLIKRWRTRKVGDDLFIFIPRGFYSGPIDPFILLSFMLFYFCGEDFALLISSSFAGLRYCICDEILLYWYVWYLLVTPLFIPSRLYIMTT